MEAALTVFLVGMLVTLYCYGQFNAELRVTFPPKDELKFRYEVQRLIWSPLVSRRAKIYYVSHLAAISVGMGAMARLSIGRAPLVITILCVGAGLGGLVQAGLGLRKLTRLHRPH